MSGPLPSVHTLETNAGLRPATEAIEADAGKAQVSARSGGQLRARRRAGEHEAAGFTRRPHATRPATAARESSERSSQSAKRLAKADTPPECAGKDGGEGKPSVFMADMMTCPQVMSREASVMLLIAWAPLLPAEHIGEAAQHVTLRRTVRDDRTGTDTVPGDERCNAAGSNCQEQQDVVEHGSYFLWVFVDAGGADARPSKSRRGWPSLDTANSNGIL